MDDFDNDYDNAPATQAADGQGDAESDDEQQDWRILASMGPNRKSLPKRGEKEYEPTGSRSDRDNLDDSRQAMYTALNGERRHTSKVHICGVWYPHLRKAKVLVARGPHFKSIGKADSNGAIWLLPEEVIYLVERGSMSLYNPRGDTNISLQCCYAACLTACHGHERYLVYAHLKRLGFIVQRAPTFDDSGEEDVETKPKISWARELWNFLVRKFIRCWTGLRYVFARKIPPFGPIVCGDIWRSYDSIYRTLQIIPFYSHKTGSPPVTQRSTTTPYRVAYNVWKPRPSFKKSSPGEPDFRVVVVNAQKDKMPTLAQADALFSTIPTAHGSGSTLQQRLNGYKNVIVGVVDYGIISFVTFGDVSFGDEHIYEKRAANSTMSKHRKMK
ncbi:tRNA-splicing endonuclease subunit sen54 N-term-domain-containing protein [Lipomyces kononenkoae]|uniref:tRNA-splicing endonuclease subunit sen54 N-term-domain-containing protein n=1 Tax=Lipomyces kononenkoae TaxID=34357 RepID=A0ACC3T815_LIPKO